MTKPDENGQNSEKPGLTERQMGAIPRLVSGANYADGCRKARISRNTLYEWLKIPEFREALEAQRRQLSDQAYQMLASSLCGAVKTLTDLLDDDDDKRLKRLVAKDLIECYAKHREAHDVEQRLAAIEAKLKK